MAAASLARNHRAPGPGIVEPLVFMFLDLLTTAGTSADWRSQGSGKAPAMLVASVAIGRRPLRDR
jgi:hypothetical protein